MLKQTLIDIRNNECTTPYIEYDGLIFDFQTNLMGFIDKVVSSDDFEKTGHYEGIFKHYEYGWVGLKMLIDENKLTKKEMSMWFDDYADGLTDFLKTFDEKYYQISYKWKPKNFKEMFVTIDKIYNKYDKKE